MDGGAIRVQYILVSHFSCIPHGFYTLKTDLEDARMSSIYPIEPKEAVPWGGRHSSRSFVCTYHPVAAGLNLKHTIYSFSICISEIVMRKGRK